MAVEIAIGNPPRKNAAMWPQRPTFEAHLNPGIGLTSFRCGFVIEVMAVGFWSRRVALWSFAGFCGNYSSAIKEFATGAGFAVNSDSLS